MEYDSMIDTIKECKHINLICIGISENCMWKYQCQDCYDTIYYENKQENYSYEFETERSIRG